jgi:hypothetical protein
MTFRGIATAACLLLALPATAQQAATEATGAQLRGVDRINGETFDLILPTGSTARVQDLAIKLNACRYPEGNASGDAFASLEIWESETGKYFFVGWMVASSPALSAMDHPRYDIWVMRCTTS